MTYAPAVVPPTVSSGRAAGRPRDPAIDASILDATVEVVRKDGYRDFSLGAVADRAGSNTPAIYRRWPSRQQLVIDALARDLGEIHAPDTGCTRCDLVEGIEMFTDAFAQSLPSQILAPLIADCASDQILHDHFMQALFLPLRRAAGEMLDRATERDELRENTDREVILDLLASMVYYRALFGHAPINARIIEDTVDLLLQGIAVDYPRLLEISRRKPRGLKHRHPR